MGSNWMVSKPPLPPVEAITPPGPLFAKEGVPKARALTEGGELDKKEQQERREILEPVR